MQVLDANGLLVARNGGLRSTVVLCEVQNQTILQTISKTMCLSWTTFPNYHIFMFAQSNSIKRNYYYNVKA